MVSCIENAHLLKEKGSRVPLNGYNPLSGGPKTNLAGCFPFCLLRCAEAKSFGLTRVGFEPTPIKTTT
jgi:hypothetical protein